MSDESQSSMLHGNKKTLRLICHRYFILRLATGTVGSERANSYSVLLLSGRNAAHMAADVYKAETEVWMLQRKEMKSVGEGFLKPC